MIYNVTYFVHEAREGTQFEPQRTVSLQINKDLVGHCATAKAF